MFSSWFLLVVQCSWWGKLSSLPPNSKGNGFRVRYISAQIVHQPCPCPVAQSPRRKEALRMKGSISHTCDQASLHPSPFSLNPPCRFYGAPSSHMPGAHQGPGVTPSTGAHQEAKVDSVSVLKRISLADIN